MQPVNGWPRPGPDGPGRIVREPTWWLIVVAVLALLTGGFIFVDFARGFAFWAHNHSLAPEGVDALTAFLLGVAPFEAGTIAGVVVPRSLVSSKRWTAVLWLVGGLWMANAINLALLFYFVGQGAVF